MSQLAQLSEAELEERFHITGRRAIALTLEGLARAGERFTVHFGQELMLTTLLAANAERGELVFDRGGSEILNRHLLDWGQCTFVARPEGVLVQFAVEEVRPVSYAGRLALVAQLPPFILRLQRRESFRILTPRSRPLDFQARVGDAEEAITLPVHDISVEGIGLSVARRIPGLERGVLLQDGSFQLAEGTLPIACTGEVRHVTEVEGRNGVKSWRVGVSFLELPPGAAHDIQRYIIRVERERSDLL